MKSDIEKIKINIEKIEKAWEENMKKEHGGGLNSKQNEILMKLRLNLKVLENAK